MLAEKQEINLLRLNQEDIYENINNWEKNFIYFLNEIYNDNNESINRYDCAFGDRYN